MPELPDIAIYCERLTDLLGGQILRGIRFRSPFVLRTVTPAPDEVAGRRFLGAGRLGKRIVWGFEGGVVAVLHLMISGRLKWMHPGATIPNKVGLLAFDFEGASLILSEASSHKRASLHLFGSREEARKLHRGGIEPLEASFDQFCAAVIRQNRTLKRTLTDPRIVSGIGNAYSDEILFWAGLSPAQRSQNLNQEELERLFLATRQTLQEWTRLLRKQVGKDFPQKVTAFRPEMAVHGRFGQSCRSCGTTIQRVRYANNETNYCPRCQTSGKLLADRALSRLLRGDFPTTIEELEEDCP